MSMRKIRIVLNLFLVVSLVFLGYAVIYSQLNIKAASEATGLMRKSDSRLRFDGSEVRYAHNFDDESQLYEEEFWYKEDANDNSYICTSGLNVPRPENITCELSTLGDSEIGLAYIINSISGQNGGAAALKNVDNGYSRYYWIELLVLRYLGNLPDPGINQKSVSQQMKTNVIDGLYKLPNGKTFSQTMTEAEEYENKYKKPINFSLDANTLVFNKRQSDNSPITSDICINDINGNIDSITVRANNNDFEISDLTTDSSGRKCFYVKIPSGKVDTAGEQVTVTVTASNKYYKASYYQCTGDNVQDLIATTTEEKNNSKEISISGSLKYPSITIKKVDENNKNLAGAQFKIECQSGECSGRFQTRTVTTLNTPTVISGSDLLPGTYIIEEIKAPDGYALPKVVRHQVTISTCSSSSCVNQNIETTFENKLIQTKISKKDITTQEELQGATLSILDSNSQTMACDAKMPNSEQIMHLSTCTWTSLNEPTTIIGLKEGTYYLVETKAPNGYKTSTQKQAFTISSTVQESTVTMYNSLNEIEISKKDITSKNELPGATLKILNSNSEQISCEAKSSSGEVTTLKSCTWVSGTEPTTIVGLKEGTYYLVETIAPDGYARNNEKVSFTITSSGVNQPVTMYNGLTQVEISKKDATTGEELPGATLRILNSQEKTISCKEKTSSGSITTINSCTWVSGTDPKTIVGLKAGTYYLEETIAPDGYVINQEKVKFTVSSTGVSSKVEMTNNYTKISVNKYTLTPGMKKLPETPGLTTVGETTVAQTAPAESTIEGEGTTYKSLPGVKLRIIDSSKKDISCKVQESGKIVELEKCEWVTDGKDKVIVGLKAGTYYLEELEAPEGYKKRTDLVKFSVTNKSKNVKLNMYNEYNSVRVSKQDSIDNDELPGATLSILNENQEKISCKIMYDTSEYDELEDCTWVSRKRPVTVYGLKEGKYYLKEVMAPEGYEYNENLIEFNVSEDEEVVMTNILSTPVPDTLSSRSVILICISMIAIAIGIGVLVYTKKYRL